MAEEEVLNVEVREERGKRKARRLRNNGHIPAVIYGHGKESVSLSVAASDVHAALRHRSKLLRLAGGLTESVVISDVQWDAFGIEVLHLDLTRVSTDESIETTVLVECRGDAPGTHAGGVLEQPIHEISIECPVVSIPDKIEVNVNSLELGDVITVGELELPSGSKLLTDSAAVVVQCIERAAEVEEEPTLAEAAEPEVIGRREEEGEGDSDQ